MVEETRVKIIKQIQEELGYMGRSTKDGRLVNAEIINNLSVAFRNLRDKE